MPVLLYAETCCIAAQKACVMASGILSQAAVACVQVLGGGVILPSARASMDGRTSEPTPRAAPEDRNDLRFILVTAGDTNRLAKASRRGATAGYHHGVKRHEGDSGNTYYKVLTTAYRATAKGSVIQLVTKDKPENPSLSATESLCFGPCYLPSANRLRLAVKKPICEESENRLQLIREQGNRYGLFEVGRRRLFHSFTPPTEKLSLAERRRFRLARLIKVTHHRI